MMILETERSSRPATTHDANINSDTSLLLSPAEASVLLQDLFEHETSTHQPTTRQKQANVGSPLRRFRQILETALFGDGQPIVDTQQDSTLDGKEDSLKKRSILTNFFLEASVFASQSGFSGLQLSIWLSVLYRSHNDLVASESINKDPASTSLSFFETHLLDLTQRSRDSGPLPFLPNDLTRMIDYFAQSYLQHVRLYLFVFGRPQAHTLHRVRKTLCAVPVPQALQTGIPADKWDEYCSQVQENTQKEVEAQQARLEKAKALEEEEARTAKALAEYAELVRVQELEEKSLYLEPIQSICLPLPQRATTTDNDKPVTEESSSNIVRRLVSQDVEFYSNALASAVEVALVERAQVIGSKMDRLKTVLEGRERLAKRPELLKKQLDQPKKK